MNIREAVKTDIENGPFDLFVEGFNLHHDNRTDIFPDLDYDGKKAEFNKMFNDKEKKIYVVLDDERVVGFIEFVIKNKKTKSLWIDELYVDKDYRYKGYGRSLMNIADKYASDNDCCRVEFNCWKFNDGANKFYSKLGYLVQRIVYEKEV